MIALGYYPCSAPNEVTSWVLVAFVAYLVYAVVTLTWWIGRVWPPLSGRALGTLFALGVLALTFLILQVYWVSGGRELLMGKTTFSTFDFFRSFLGLFLRPIFNLPRVEGNW